MGESSTSRYGIVNNLTDTKLDLISAKSELEEDIKKKQHKVDELKKNLVDWESDITEQIKINTRVKNREIENAEIELKNAESRKSTKEKMFDEKLRTVDAALEKIEKISESAGPSTQI